MPESALKSTIAVSLSTIKDIHDLPIETLFDPAIVADSDNCCDGDVKGWQSRSPFLEYYAVKST